MSDARPHPPSDRHLQAGLRAGLFPRSELIGAAASCCGLLAGLAACARSGFAHLQQLTRAALAAEPPAPTAALSVLAFALLPVALAALLALALRRVLVGFASPSAPRLRSARPPVRSDTGRALALLALAAFALGASALCLRAELSGLLALMQSQLGRLAIILLVCALIEALFARAAFVRALHLTRAEFTDEQRELHGAEAVRRARQAARSALSAPDAPGAPR